LHELRTRNIGIVVVVAIVVIFVFVVPKHDISFSLTITQNGNVCSSFTDSNTRSSTNHLKMQNQRIKKSKKEKKENQMKTLIDWLAKRNGRGSI
jgi:flagellar motor component MotA